MGPSGIASVHGQNGLALWSSDRTASSTVPILLPTGISIEYDSESVISYTPGGAIATFAQLFTTESKVYSLGASDEGRFMILSFQHGSIAAFLEDGIPMGVCTTATITIDPFLSNVLTTFSLFLLSLCVYVSVAVAKRQLFW
jgi:hypothetical protein